MDTRPISINYIIGSLNRGGAETHLLRIIGPLVAKGFNVRVFAFEGGDLKEDYEKTGAEINISNKTVLLSSARVSRTLRILKILLWMSKELATKKAEIVHYFLPEAYCLGSVATFFSPRSIRVMSRRSLNNYKSRRPFVGKIEEYFHFFTDYFLGNSTEVCSQLMSEPFTKPDKIHLIYNGIPIPPMNHSGKLETRMRLNLPQDRFICTLVANIIPYKGHQDLIEAAAIIKSKGYDPLFICIGKGDGYLDKLVQMTKEKNLESSFLWTGQKSNIWPYLYSSDIALNCSHEEGFSNAILEAMACSLPVVATSVGGNKDAIFSGNNGILVPPKAPNELAAGILLLLNDENLRQKMGTNSKNLAEEKYSLTASVEAYQNFYKKIMRK